MARPRVKAAPRRAVQPATHPPSDQLHADASDSQQLTFRQHALAFVKELAAVVVGAVIVASLLRGFVGQMFLIPSISMENTLQVDDRVVVEKLGTAERGEVVVFKDPGGWLTGATARQRGPIGRAFQFIGVLPDTGTEHLIKRVVGVQGDRVACCTAAGRLTVNGEPLEETSYLNAGPGGAQLQPSAITFDVVVPLGHFFVMGDNRDHSRDSRCHLHDVQPGGGATGQNAFVSQDLVVGHAIAVVWPLDRQHRLAIPDTFDSVPPALRPAPDAATITAGPEASC
jgi:signal peptidase I